MLKNLARWAALLLCLAPASVTANNCVEGKPCGDTCIARNETCHVDGGADNGPPTIGKELVIGSLLTLSGAGLAWWGYSGRTDGEAKLAALFSVVVAGSTCIWAPIYAGQVKTEQERSGERSSRGSTEMNPMVPGLMFVALNVAVVTWDVLIMMGKSRRWRSSRWARTGRGMDGNPGSDGPRNLAPVALRMALVPSFGGAAFRLDW